jgi:hypothetical protein
VIVDLETVDPRGRLDVAAYRGIEMLSRRIEATHNVVGIWDVLKPHANTLINKYLGSVEIPLEAEALLQLVMMNRQKEG